MRGEDDRDDAGGRSDGLDLGRSRREDNVDVAADQLGGLFGQLFGCLSPSKDEIDVLALDIAMVPQAHPQCFYPVRRLGGRTIAEISDPPDLPRRLRPRRERCGEQGSQASDEGAPPHYSMTSSARSSSDSR